MLKWQLYAVSTTGMAWTTVRKPRRAVPPSMAASGNSRTSASFPSVSAVRPRAPVVTAKHMAMAMDTVLVEARFRIDLSATRGTSTEHVTTLNTTSLDRYHGAASPPGVPNRTGSTPRMSAPPTSTSLAMMR